VVPVLIQLLLSPRDDLHEQVLWALGNIAGDSAKLRDFILQSDGLQPVMKVLEKAVEEEKTLIIRRASWTLCNLCRGTPPPHFEWVAPALGMLAKLICRNEPHHWNDVQLLADVCWALSYLSNRSNEGIAGVIQSGICQRLVELLRHPSSLVQTPALRTVGNIASGDDHQISVLLQHGVLAQLGELLIHPKKAIQKEACWTISNIMLGSREQIQVVFDNQLIAPVLQFLEGSDYALKREAAWAIHNATSRGSPEQVELLVGQGCVRPIVEFLDATDVKIVIVALTALDNILRLGKEIQVANGAVENPYVALVEEADGVGKIEALQEDPNGVVYQKAAEMVETYFTLEPQSCL